jgi:hypothetical protein
MKITAMQLKAITEASGAPLDRSDIDMLNKEINAGLTKLVGFPLNVKVTETNNGNALRRFTFKDVDVTGKVGLKHLFKSIVVTHAITHFNDVNGDWMCRVEYKYETNTVPRETDTLMVGEIYSVDGVIHVTVNGKKI